MLIQSTLSATLVFGTALSAIAQEEPTAKPAELKILKASVGVWDAEIDVWAMGPNSPAVQFKGVETNRAFGEYWLASDFVSEFMGQKIKVHTIVGYDLDKKKLVGKIIDHGPYAATMTGEYDEKKKTIYWMTKAKTVTGQPMVQKTVVTFKGDDERLLVMSMQGKDQEKFTRFMQIRYVKRK